MNDSLKAIAYLGAKEIAPESYRLVINEQDYPNSAEEWRDERFATYNDAYDCIPRALRAKRTACRIERIPALYAFSDTLPGLIVATDDSLREGNFENRMAGHRMPAWWSPDQRFAWRDAKGFMYFHAERAKAYNATERITADLTTGAEVPA